VARKVWKWVAENPFGDIYVKEMLDLDNGRDGWLTHEEEKILLEVAIRPGYLRDLIIFATPYSRSNGLIRKLETNVYSSVMSILPSTIVQKDNSQASEKCFRSFLATLRLFPSLVM